MGELVSYVPDFDFEKNDINSPTTGARNIWKSLADGKSVCNGITEISRNILSRLGIKTHKLSSKTHAFLLAETEEGNIITDATWDLTNTLYKGRPNYFGITYYKLREQEREISDSHKLENPPENVIEISDKELREIYHSIGLTNEDGKFPLPILEKVSEINSHSFNSTSEKVESFLEMFKKEFPKEARHLTETRTMLEICMQDLEIRKENVKTQFVYQKQDNDCVKPYLILNIEEEKMQDTIYLLNPYDMRIEKMNAQELDKEYKVHNNDERNSFWKKYLQEQQIQKEESNEKLGGREV